MDVTWERKQINKKIKSRIEYGRTHVFKHYILGETQTQPRNRSPDGTKMNFRTLIIKAFTGSTGSGTGSQI